jgi:hypothetical protein
MCENWEEKESREEESACEVICKILNVPTMRPAMRDGAEIRNRQ